VSSYRSLSAVAYSLSIAVLANLALPMLLDGVAARRAWLASIFVAITLTLVFVHRAARNLNTIGEVHPRFTPGQAVGWLLVPLANIYMGHQVLTALWRDSQPRPREVRRSGADFSVLAVNIWFGVGLAGLLLKNLLQDLALQASFRRPLIGGLLIAQGVAFIVVVLGIADRQREQWIDLERRRAVPRPTADQLR
jgi:Domain of unknown function (DUF4328)